MNQQQSSKLPTLSKLPLQLNPSYKLKFQNPLRVQFLRFLEHQDLSKNETFYIRNYAKIHNYPLTDRQLPQKEQIIHKKKPIYHKPNFKYFHEDDSDVDQEQVLKIIQHKNKKTIN